MWNCQRLDPTGPWNIKLSCAQETKIYERKRGVTASRSSNIRFGIDSHLGRHPAGSPTEPPPGCVARAPPLQRLPIASPAACRAPILEKTGLLTDHGRGFVRVVKSMGTALVVSSKFRPVLLAATRTFCGHGLMECNGVGRSGYITVNDTHLKRSMSILTLRLKR